MCITVQSGYFDFDVGTTSCDSVCQTLGPFAGYMYIHASLAHTLLQLVKLAARCLQIPSKTLYSLFHNKRRQVCTYILHTCRWMQCILGEWENVSVHIKLELVYNKHYSRYSEGLIYVRVKILPIVMIRWARSITRSIRSIFIAFGNHKWQRYFGTLGSQ